MLTDVQYARHVFSVPAGRRRCKAAGRGQCCGTGSGKWWEEEQEGQEQRWPPVQTQSLKQEQASETKNNTNWCLFTVVSFIIVTLPETRKKIQ